ncbi:MAG: hypothetical protein ACQETH_06320, partial [Candidatus Rifleibacteriota bacterium]
MFRIIPVRDCFVILLRMKLRRVPRNDIILSVRFLEAGDYTQGGATIFEIDIVVVGIYVVFNV